MNNGKSFIFDGIFKSIDENIIPAESRGLMYGDGCFETFRSYSGQFFELDMHLKRLREGMQFLDMAFPDLLKPDSFKALLYKLLVKNNLLNEDALIRLQVWRKGGRGYRTEHQSSAHFSVTARGWKGGASSPVTLAMVDVRCIPDQSLPSRYKLSNGINYITASNKARNKQADDALMLTIDGFVSETTIANVFWVKDEVVYTPSTKCDVLPGITRQAVLNVIKQSTDYEIKEGIYPPETILDADAVWVCNSVRELVPVHNIDERTYPEHHPVFENIQKKFEVYRDQKLAKIQ